MSRLPVILLLSAALIGCAGMPKSQKPQHQGDYTYMIDAHAASAPSDRLMIAARALHNVCVNAPSLVGEGVCELDQMADARADDNDDIIRVDVYTKPKDLSCNDKRKFAQQNLANRDLDLREQLAVMQMLGSCPNSDRMSKYIPAEAIQDFYAPQKFAYVEGWSPAQWEQYVLSYPYIIERICSEIVSTDDYSKAMESTVNAIPELTLGDYVVSRGTLEGSSELRFSVVSNGQIKTVSYMDVGDLGHVVFSSDFVSDGPHDVVDLHGNLNSRCQYAGGSK